MSSTVAGGQRAASKPGLSDSARVFAPAAVDVAGTWTTAPRRSAIHPRHCAHACEWVEMARMSSRRVPGLTASENAIGTSISALICSAEPSVSASSVALTPPSTEFSIGTTA